MESTIRRSEAHVRMLFRSTRMQCNHQQLPTSWRVRPRANRFHATGERRIGKTRSVLRFAPFSPKRSDFRESRRWSPRDRLIRSVRSGAVRSHTMSIISKRHYYMRMNGICSISDDMRIIWKILFRQFNKTGYWCYWRVGLPDAGRARPLTFPSLAHKLR
ncbi:uncharacterized protein LOC143218527 [Lasioglossum baleicum]|uniref:uncharacterized protein LOC143218527 n=1 Tax=Lasioglossum baleicum TaxID=434251 RepID=UPI003FCD9323